MDKTAELQSDGLTEVMFLFASMMQHQKSSFMIFACFFKECSFVQVYSATSLFCFTPKNKVFVFTSFFF